MNGDCFALLGVPRRPWLEEEELKERLHRLTAEHHPDVVGGSGEHFREINAAYTTLHDPRTRIAHLLAVESLVVESGDGRIPPPLADLFLSTGGVRQKLEAFLAKEEKATTPIAKATLAGEKFELIDTMEAQLALLAEAEATLIDELRNLDARWDEGKAGAAPRLAEIAHSLAFFKKWIAQLREGLFKLSL